MTPRSDARSKAIEEAASDLYKALVSEHGHDEKAGAPWPACLPVHIAMNRYRDATQPVADETGEEETPE